MYFDRFPPPRNDFERLATVNGRVGDSNTPAEPSDSLVQFPTVVEMAAPDWKMTPGRSVWSSTGAAVMRACLPMTHRFVDDFRDLGNGPPGLAGDGISLNYGRRIPALLLVALVRRFCGCAVARCAVARLRDCACCRGCAVARCFRVTL